MALALAQGRPDFSMLGVTPGYEELMESFNSYYWRLQPPPPPEAKFMFHLDWADWRHYRYYTDFVSRSGMKFSLMPFAGLRVNVTLHRSRLGGDFSDAELHIFGTMARHVSQIYDVLDRIEALERFRRPALDGPPKIRISPRETDIVRLLALRLTAPQIGSVLNISTRTVEQHIVHLYEKCGAWDRQSLLRKVLMPNPDHRN